MIDECPMTEECPGFDRDARVCLLRPDGCEFAPASADAAPELDAPGASATTTPLPTGPNPA